MDVILNINDLNYLEIWNNFSLSVEKGKIISIAGSNNSGKTTLTRILDRKIVDNFNINLLGKDINNYSMEDYYNHIQIIYPDSLLFKEEKPIEEINRYDSKKNKYILDELRSRKILEKDINKLSFKDKLLVKISLSVIKAEDLIIIDNMDYYLNDIELDEVYELINNYVKKYKTSFIIMTTNLNHVLNTDYLYIIQNGNVVIKGDPLTVLHNDNTINKAGLIVPFMIDLSVKLRDYDLIKEIETDKERLIDELWN